MREIILPLPGEDAACRLLIGWGAHRDLGALLAPAGYPPRVFVISDTRVAGLYAPTVEKALADGGFKPVTLAVPVGERSKRWQVVRRLARDLLAGGAHRKTLLLALGGGVVGDLTGFLASLYMRGVPVVQVPTTLLAMVDAAIGGKTAVNLPEGKNLLGTFHHPRLVLIDPAFLQTLPRRERLNGLAEVLKAGFLRDVNLLKELAAVRLGIFSDQDRLTAMIGRAAEIKVDIVAADAREADLRRLLNFGHTLGHGLEAASRFRLPHGRAVALGMLAALRLSADLTGLPPEEARFGRELIRGFGYTRPRLRLERESVLAALAHDKKRHDAGLAFVLLKRLAEPVILDQVPLPLIGRALDEVLTGQS